MVAGSCASAIHGRPSGAFQARKPPRFEVRSPSTARTSLLRSGTSFNLFRDVDVGFKVVGTGSVGLRDYMVLLEGNGPQDPMFLQIKQEVASAYAKFLPDVAHPHEGRRAADGQRAIQPISDLLLGWTTIGPHHYLVRQLNDHKGSIDLQNLRGGGLRNLALVAGELLARGHARSGDACEISGYCGSGAKMAKALRDFACQYADQTESDYRAFTTAIKRGKVKVAEVAPNNCGSAFSASSARASQESNQHLPPRLRAFPVRVSCPAPRSVARR